MSASVDLTVLDEAVCQALESGDESELRVLGYGEISAVLAWPPDAPSLACKRLPPFRDEAQLEAYREVLEDYVAALGSGGITVAPTDLEPVEGPHGLAAYLVQPLYPAERLVPRALAEGDEASARRLFAELAERVIEAVTDRLGLDGQISNWVVGDDGGLTYVDLTTPLIRDEQGAERLEADLFLVSLPWALRGPVRRFMIRGILEHYYAPRPILLDAAANLHKEGLAVHMPAFLDEANARVEEPIQVDEVRRYYRSDARTWAFLQRLRRIDRWWRRRIRRRVYPFLIPKVIERHV